MRYTVEEFVDISKLAKLVISEEVEWDTIGRDHPCKQYRINNCIDALEEYDLGDVFKKDIETLKELEREDVTYIEF